MAHPNLLLKSTHRPEAHRAREAASNQNFVLTAERAFHRLSDPSEIRTRLADVLDYAQQRCEELILTEPERHEAALAHARLCQFLGGLAQDRSEALRQARHLSGVISAAGDLPLARALNAGFSALLHRQMAH